MTEEKVIVAAKEKEYSTRDKPAEKGITINNILMGLLLVGGGTFATHLTDDVSEIKDDTNVVKEKISAIQVTDGMFMVEMNSFKEVLVSLKNSLDHHKQECNDIHKELDKRLKELELFMEINRNN